MQKYPAKKNKFIISKKKIVRANHEWSDFQKAIFKDIAEGTGNSLVISRAGSSKTSSLVEGAFHIPKGKSALFCAFSKSVQEELKERLPSNVPARTLHSLGLAAIKNRFGKNVEIDDYKTWKIVETLVSEPEDSDLISNICDTVRFCKATITDIPSKIEELVDCYGLDFCGLDPSEFSKIVVRALRKCKETTNVIDFADMVWMPFVYSLPNPKFDYVFVDECFPYDQFIATENGKTKIGTLVKKFKKGEKLPKVISYNEEENKFEASKITNAWDRGKKQLVKIECGKRSVKCTPNHKFLTSNGWVKAEDLAPGMLIKTSSPVSENNLSQNEGHLQFALNEDQEQIVLGSFLGDGGLHKMSNFKYRLKVIHGKKQKNYLKFKSDILDGNISFIKENGFAQKPAYTFSTKSFSLPYLFPKNKSTCPQWVLDKLDARGLAIWIMDDGSFANNCMNIWTSSFNEASQNRIAKKLQSMGIDCKVASYLHKKKKKRYFYIRVNTSGTKTLIKLIEPYFHKDLLYKLGKTSSNIKKYHWNNKFEPFGYTVVSKVIKTSEYKKVYDIEVEKNHNFIVCSSAASKSRAGLIAHNCQDLTKVQIELALSMVKRDGRIIAVLDDRQAIFQWAGTDTDVLPHLKERLGGKELTLPICYRCPVKVVELAQTIVPDIQIFEKAIPGEIINLSTNDLLDTIKPGSYLLSRYNAPLIKWIFKLLKSGVPANILGRDIGQGLLMLVKKSKKKSVEDFLVWLDRWEASEKNRILKKNPRASIEFITDKAECLRALCEGSETLQEVKKNCDELFGNGDEKNVVLGATPFRAKGGERDDVFVLEDTLNDSTEMERNVRYVSYTRTKSRLFLVRKPSKFSQFDDKPKKNLHSIDEWDKRFDERKLGENTRDNWEVLD